MFGRSERLRIVLIITAALVLAGLFVWSFSREVDAQGVCDGPCAAFCDELNSSDPQYAPWRLERSRDEGELCWCECCDSSGDRSWQVRLPNPGVEPTDRPTATRIRIRATSTAIAATSTPEPTSTRVNTPTLEPTWTINPTEPAAPDTPTATKSATSVPLPSTTPSSTSTALTPRPSASSTASSTPSAGPSSTPTWATVKPTTTRFSNGKRAVDPGRNCIPTHAGAPVRLCPTGSGSGWWIYDSETGQILQDGEGRLAHVPFVERLPAGEAQVLFASKRLVAVWMGNRVVVSTRYEDGKAYVFSVLEGGRVVHWQW